MPKKAKMKGLGLPANVLQDFIQLSYSPQTRSPDGFELDEELSDSRVKVYTKNNSKEVVVVHRGSVGADDWIDNAKYFAFGSVKNTKTFKLHKERQLKAIEKYGANNIIGVGHSRAGLYLQALQKEYPIKEIITYNKAVGFYDMLRTNPKEQTDVKVKNDFVSLLSGLQKRPKPMVEIDATANPLDFNKAHQPKELEKLGDTFIGLKDEKEGGALNKISMEDLNKTKAEENRLRGGGRPPKEKSLEELKKVLEKLLKQKEKMDKGKVYKTTNIEKLNYDINYTKNRITNYNEKGSDLIVTKIKATSKTLDKKAEKLLKEYDEIMTPKKKRGRPKKIKEEPKKEEQKKRGRPKKTDLVGKGKDFTKKQLTNIILHKNKVIADLEENAYGGNVMKGGGTPAENQARREAREAQERTIPEELRPEFDKLKTQRNFETLRSKFFEFNYDNLRRSEKSDYDKFTPEQKVYLRTLGNPATNRMSFLQAFQYLDTPEKIRQREEWKREKAETERLWRLANPPKDPPSFFSGNNRVTLQDVGNFAGKTLLSVAGVAETLATPINPLPFSIVDTISGLTGITTHQKDFGNALRQQQAEDGKQESIGQSIAMSILGAGIGKGTGEGIKEQNSKVLKMAKLLENINNSENGTKMVGGAMSEEELKDFNDMKALIAKQKLENEKLTEKLAKAIEDNETGTARKRKVKSFDAYDILNLNKFLKTQDEVFLNPEVYAYDEDQTAFDKFLKKNPKYYREYQKKFIEDWSVSSQECVILYYGVGSGKTMIAVNCAEQFAVLNPNSSVYFLVPASLVFGTIKEMYRRGIDPTRKNDEGEYIYYFVSYQQFLNTDLIFQPNSLLIVDEIHNLRNFYTMAITEKMSSRKWKTTENYSIVGTKLGTTLLLNENKFLRTIFMTGTLFVNSKYDLEPIISIGYKKTPLYKHEKDNLDLLMYDENAFKQYYQGLISYYKIPEDNKEFPSTKYHFEKVEYEPTEAYELTSYKAKQILKKGKKDPEYDENERVKDKKYTYKDLIDGITTGDFEDILNDLPEKDAYLINSRNQSIVAKGRWIVKFLKKHKKEKTIIYSQFKGYTLEPLYKILNKEFKELKYGVIDGSLNATEKKKVMDKYNNDEINVLFFTLSIKEGISFKETKNVIINEPYWNYAILEQIIARALRLDSHKKGYKSLVNIHFLVGVKGDDEPDRENEWFKEATDIMNTGIKKLTYEATIYKDKDGKDIISFLTMNKYEDLYYNSPDIRLYNLMFNKQEGINVFEKKLLEQPRFEKVNDNENNEFIKTYNLALLEMPDLTNKQKIVMKRKMYKDFYEENIKEVNKRLQRFNEDSKFKSNRNPDLEETKILLDDDNEDLIRKMINQNKSLTEIITKLGGINKQIITNFQANFTPKSEVDLLINYSGIKDDNREDLKILEPTAGVGNVIRGLVNMPIGANMFIDCNELNKTFYNIGKLYFEGIDNIKWSNIDFMTLTSRVGYDYILGNPPFNIRTQRVVLDKETKIAKKIDVTYHDVDFVAKAFNMLGVGGVLCMIISDRYLRDNSLTKFDIFRKQLAKYIPNHEVFKIEGGFKQDDTILKEMETSTGMICIKLIKDENNVNLDLENTNFLYDRNNPVEIEKYETIKKAKAKEKKELTKQAKLIEKQLDKKEIKEKKEKEKKETKKETKKKEPKEKKETKKKEEPQNIKMIIEEKKEEKKEEKVDEFFKLILDIEHEDLYQILNQMGYGVPKYKNKIELNMRLATALTPKQKERFIELYKKKKLEGGKIKKKK